MARAQYIYSLCNDVCTAFINGYFDIQSAAICDIRIIEKFWIFCYEIQSRHTAWKEMRLIHNPNLDNFSEQVTNDTLNIFKLILTKIDKSKEEPQQFIRDVFENNVRDKKRCRIESIKKNMELIIKYLKDAEEI